MIYSKAAHPNCMYLWMNYIISPEANAKVAEWFGEAPSNAKACDLTTDPDHCTNIHANDERVLEEHLLLDHAPGGLRRRPRRRLQGRRRTGEPPGPNQGVSDALYSPRRSRRPGRSEAAALVVLPPPLNIRLGGLLVAPVGWLAVVYLGSLFLLLVAAFWDTDPLRTTSSTTGTSTTFASCSTGRVQGRRVAHDQDGRPRDGRRCVLAFPIAYYMARIASPRTRNLLVVAVLTPLWASYLVKAYAWRTMLGEQGVHRLGAEPVGLTAPGDWTSLWLTFTYFWLPFMILPIYAGLERIPLVAVEASADLGARSVRTFWRSRCRSRFLAPRGGLDLHVLAHARRLHPARPHCRPAVHRHGHLRRPWY